MKNIFTLLLILPLFTFAQEQPPSLVSQSVAAMKGQTGEFPAFEVFEAQTRNASQSYSEAVSDGIVVPISPQKINNILAEQPQQMKLTIPFQSVDGTIDLELIKVEVFSPNFRIRTNTGADITDEVDLGIHYRGMIANEPHSLVSISIYETQIIGMVANHHGSFTIGRLEDSNTDHIIYRDGDLKMATEFLCETEDDGVGYTEEQLATPTSNDPGDVLDIYIESGQSVYNAFAGDLIDTVAFLTGVFAECYTLYANDGIAARSSSMFVWIETDPYNSGSSSGQLNLFRANTGQNAFDGDLGHLVEVQNSGGIASGFDGICAPNSDDSLCFSGFTGTTFESVPTYSFNVFILAHEMGHLMGSRHTHACVWNGDNTAIDGCAGFTEGNCPLPGIPADGGTIMSYCTFTGVGVNFNHGFGPQPTAVILNNIEATGNCLEPLGTLVPPTAVCTNYTVELDAFGNATITAADVDGGSYDDMGIVTYEIDISSFTCDDIGVNDVTLTVTDGDGLSHFCVALVRVEDNSEPTVSDCPADETVSVNEGDTYTLPDYTTSVTAEDNCDYTLSQSPEPDTELSVGVYTITITAEDPTGNQGDCSFELTVDEILGTNDNSLNANITFSPNPSSGILQLSNPLGMELERFSVYDLTGRLMTSVDLSEMGTEMTIDLSSLSTAVYMIVIDSGTEKATRQLIKR
ncbi:MAG: M12 family metallo-peptidase [Bacteroidota bacterium]